jgi:hypothetical protein
MDKVKVAVAYRSPADSHTASHQGLGICAINTVKTLNQHGIRAYVWPVFNVDTIGQLLEKDPEISHVVIQAPWIPTDRMWALANRFPNVQFSTNCHSNVAFLQTEPQAITLLLDLCNLEQSSNNIHVSGNSRGFVDWIHCAYQVPCLYLPNLYYLDKSAEMFRPAWNGGLLRIGIFGAPRAQKNVMTAVAASIEIAQHLKAHTEIWLNGGRDERDGKTIREAARRAVSRNPFCTFKEFGWAAWPEFRRFIGTMNLAVQISHTESFNQVTADGVAMGVPSVTSNVIRWVPSYWHADADSVADVCRVGVGLIRNPLAARDGLNALRRYNQDSLGAWRRYLSGSLHTETFRF